MKKVVFLDIDGVLNNEVFVNAFWAICEQVKVKNVHELFGVVVRDDYGTLFCPTATNMLNWIVESTGAKIVITSTWRMSGIIAMQEMWKLRKLPSEVIDVTPCIRLDREDEGLSFKERGERGNEIKLWLSENPVDSYVIIDEI